jgi:apolipoprotein D and lipocalin family protein
VKPAHKRRARDCLIPAISALSMTVCLITPAHAQAEAALEPLPSLNVASYMGTWYQVAWFPNRFQKQCVSDTTAAYRLLPEGRVEVVNRCKRADGSIDSVTGVARPSGSVLRGGQLEPARLEVSFLPTWLRWLPIWGNYWVLELAPDGRYAVVSEPGREYLWVLARQPTLPSSDETAIRSRLLQRGFDLSRWQAHPHAPAALAAQGLPASAPTPAPAHGRLPDHSPPAAPTLPPAQALPSAPAGR